MFLNLKIAVNDIDQKGSVFQDEPRKIQNYVSSVDAGVFDLEGLAFGSVAV